MAISKELKERNGDLCELCNTEPATQAYTVSPKNSDSIENQVALCDKCVEEIDKNEQEHYWRFLEGSIWNPEPSIQALSYRILHQYKDKDWVSNLLSSVDLDESVIAWAMHAYQVPNAHKDVYGNILQHGDNVVLTEQLNVKGTSFTASKGTVVKKIKLVHDNFEQIEGKINDQTIVILTKFVKKG